MRSLKRILFLLFLLPGIVFSQERLVLTLEKSVSMALERNPEIKVAEKEVAKARAGVGEAVSNILPQLDGSVNFQHNWKIQKQTIPNFLKTMLGPLASPDMPDVVQISFGLENTFQYGLTVMQPLFLGGAGVAGIRMATAGKHAAEQNLELTRQNLIFQTVNAFYNCLLTADLVSVQEEALNQAQANLDVVTKKYNVGMASGFDKMRAEVDVANLQPAVIAARNNREIALTNLRMVLGLEKSTEISVSGEFRFEEDDFGKLALADIQNMALINRPEVKALQEQKYITQQNITIARSNFLPKLFFQTDYSFLAMRNNLKIGQNDFSEGFTSAISLQIPLFHGFRSSNQYQKARLDHKIMLDTDKQLRDGVNAEVEVVFNTFQEAKEKFLSARQTVDLAQEALRLANLMYDEGANTQLDVLSSQLALTQARMNFASSLYEYQVARYQLRKVTGQLKGIL